MAMLAYGAVMMGIGDKRVRLIGAALMVISMLSFFFYHPPDIIVSANGKLFVVHYQGNYYFSEKRSSRFIRKIWSESLGVNNIKSIKQGFIPECSSSYCKIDQALITTIEIKEPYDACSHKLIIDMSDEPIKCSSTATMVITLQQLANRGAHMFWLADKPSF